MPTQETFLDRKTGDKRIQVIKTYDQRRARVAFEEMNEAAQAFLWQSLKVEQSYEASDLPPLHSAEWEEFLWEELLEESREDGNVLSFFIVTASIGATTTALYVSPHWPSAEQFVLEIPQVD
jgi:hypothetical protein